MSNEIVEINQNTIPAVDLGFVKLSKTETFNMLNDARALGDVASDEVINVAGYLRSTCSLTTNDGVVEEDHPILYIFTADSKPIACVSITFQRRFLQLMEFFGTPSSWKKPIPLMVQKVASKNNRVFYSVKIKEDK